MSLAPGTRLGPYEISSLIGTGGMSEVYQAKDTRLNRTVAIKILSAQLSSHPDHRSRFEREARTISTLSDPHICSLYDVGQENGLDFLVMEFLQGETLAERLTRGPLSIDQILQYGIQISSAMEKAHKQGIIHRDLKPGNIMITKSGIKLLDFGLAKIQEFTADSETISQLGTEQADITAEGTILGTVPYMSPEQVEGKALDERTDIFSFGAILFEMATGRRAFQGKSKASVISSILRDEPPKVSSLQPISPSAMDYVVRTCLNKDPDLRWQSARDVSLALNGIKEGYSIPEPSHKPRKTTLVPWILLSLLSGALLTFGALKLSNPKLEKLSVQFHVFPPPGTTFGGPSTVPSLAISPDGKKLAFIAAYPGKNQTLWIRDLNSVTSHSLAGTEGAHYPFWSPDGQYVAYGAGGKIFKVNPNGGPAQLIINSDTRAGASWGTQGSILFSPSAFHALYEVSASGSTPKKITNVDHSNFEAGNSWPLFLPDGRHFLYFVLKGGEQGNEMYVGELSSNQRKLILTQNVSLATYSPPGYLVFVRGDTLVVQNFDLKKLELSGQPVPVAENVGHYDDAGPSGYAPVSVSNNGVLAFGKVSKVQAQLVWVDRNGKQLGTASAIGRHGEPALSPDEKQVAVAMIKDGETDIWLIEVSRSIPTRLTNNEVGRAPVWSPNGEEVVSISEEHGGIDFYAMNADGSGEGRLVLHTTLPKIPDDWSRDGRFLIYEVDDPKTRDDLWILPMTGKSDAFPFLATENNETNATFSPDANWIAYTSDESGQMEVYVKAFGNHTSKWRVSSEGGRMPRWRNDGKELFYVVGDSQFMSVPIEYEPTFKMGTPVPMFQMQMAELGITAENRTQYAVSADGKRFLINKRIEETKQSPITIITNWTQNLFQ